MTVKLCTSQKVSGKSAVWQGRWKHPREERGGLLRDGRESIKAGSERVLLLEDSTSSPEEKKKIIIIIASWTKSKGVCR